MVRKKLAVAILALSALQANFADAMGLGNLSVKSALNQPLSAEIKLLDTGDLDPSQIKIQLAAPEDFQRAGVDRDYFLTNLHFSVDMDGHGGGTIKVTTREPVVEPYLNFVIEARWPNGRLLREFAVLLDPPTFSANKAAAPVTPATSGAQSVKPRAAQPPVVKTETETTTSAPPADMSLPAATKTGEYRIQVYDTLSKIAARVKPASDVSVAQTMLAIQRANPQAFIRNNVNLIKSGYVLRLPTADEARSVTAEQAAQEVDSQMQEWRGGRSAGSVARAPAAGPQLDASAPEPSKKEGGYREQARLSIATAGDTDKNGSGSGSSKGIEALRQQLTESQESLEKGKRDNKELQSRLDDMERQIATLQRLISLKDEQLAALQSKSAGAKSAAPQVAAPAAEKPATSPQAPANAEPTAPATTPAPAPTPAAPTPAPEAATPKPAAPVPAPAVPKPPVKRAAPAVESSFFDQIVENRNNYLYAGIAAILLALGIPMLIKRQRRKAWLERQEEESDSLSFDSNDDFKFDTEAFDEATAEEQPEAVAAPAAAEEIAQPAAEAPKKAVRSETGDPIAESDIYIAYGRYQQAVDLLTNAIDAEPNRSDLRVKLLEVYIEMRNKDAFRQQYVALQSLGDSGAIARVKDLLSSVDGISDWLDDLPGGGSHVASAIAAGAAAAAVASELDLEFDHEEIAEEPEIASDDLDTGDEFSELESSFTHESDLAEDEPVELDLDLDDELGSADISGDLNETKSTPSFDNTFGKPDVEVPGFESASAFEAPVEESADAAFEEDGLELDLGDDDLDRALSNMGATETLGDLEEMPGNLEDLQTSAPVSADLSGDLELPEEFDLSQPSTELPEVERAESEEFGGLSSDEDFEDPFVEPAAEPEQHAEPQPEMDVFAGLNEPAPAPIAEPQPAAEAPTPEGGDDFDFLADADEVATKLDLARAYIDMGDTEGAKDILDEVLQEGTDTQKEEASSLLSRIG
jgi:pilus assembly protein FimV